MTQKIIEIDPREFESVLLRFKEREVDHLRGELGIDVSRHQDIINWLTVANHSPRIGFAGIRATMGTRGTRLPDGTTPGLDPQFARNWAEAKRVKIQRLPYHYYANNGVDPTRQLDNFLSALGDDLGELPPVLDVETTTGQIVNDKRANEAGIKVWLEGCENRIGRRPIIYTNLTAWSKCTTIPPWSNTYSLWLAHYTTAPLPRVPLPWIFCQVWQYSSTGTIPGIVGNVDLDRWGPYP